MSLFVMIPMMSLFFWVNMACVWVISEFTRIKGVVMRSMGNGSSRILLMGCSFVFSPLLARATLITMKETVLEALEEAKVKSMGKIDRQGSEALKLSKSLVDQ